MMPGLDIIQSAQTAHFAFLRRMVKLTVQAYADGLNSLPQDDRSALLRWVGFYVADYLAYRDERGLNV